MSHSTHSRVAIVGNGFSGLGIAAGLKQAGEDFVIYEKADDIGGTWRDNTYPGCRCDVPSHLYSFSFAPNPDWTETYSPQAEIFDYLRKTADELGLVAYMRFSHEVLGADWDGAAQVWRLDTSRGERTANVLVLGNGALSVPAIPEFEGLDEFSGPVVHSARWQHDLDLTGKRVAVVGTGASTIQFLPEIQPEVASLTLFQRTPPWVLPHPNRGITNIERAVYRRLPAVQRLVRERVYWLNELRILAFAKFPGVLNGLRRLGELNIKRGIDDPELRATVTPDYTPGCKRLVLSDNYYPALAQDNVEDVTAGIAKVLPNAIVTADGREVEVDAILLGTGFHVTDNPIASIIRGSGGVALEEVWSEGAQAYKGTTVSGFPNLFMMTGPNTGIGHTSLVVMIEAQIPYILEALAQLDRPGVGAVDVRAHAQVQFNRDVQKKMESTIWSTGGCSSWYMDANGLNTVLWPDFTSSYRNLMKRFDIENYDVIPAAVTTAV